MAKLILDFGRQYPAVGILRPRDAAGDVLFSQVNLGLVALTWLGGTSTAGDDAEDHHAD